MRSIMRELISYIYFMVYISDVALCCTLYLVFGLSSCQRHSAEAVETFGPMHNPLQPKVTKTFLWLLQTAKE